MIRSGCYVQRKAGRNDKRTSDHRAVDRYYTCHTGELLMQQGCKEPGFFNKPNPVVFGVFGFLDFH